MLHAVVCAITVVGTDYGCEVFSCQSSSGVSGRVFCCECYFVCVVLSVYLIVVLGMTNRYR